MPEIELHFTDQELAELERVQRQQGLASLQQAAEWLAKTSIRRNAERMTGTRRAIRLVVPPGKKP